MLKIINIFVKVEILKFVNMDVKLRVLSAGVLFFIGHSAMAQKVKKDSSSTKEIEEVVVIGYGKQKKNEVTSSISTIKGSAMENLNTPSFENQLAGRSSGVQVVANSGIVGSAPTVRVRGVNSITGGTSPLYVVDGIPVISGDIGVGYVGANALGDINPNDIESISVLKDGAATAIYGSRAANGVILITTKKGKGGKFTLSYNNLFSIASPSKYFDLLHTPDFLKITAEKTAPLNLSTPNKSWANGDTYDTDWQKAVLRNASQQDHNLSFSGGMGQGSYYASLGYTYQEGIIIPNSMQRFTMRLNADQKVTNWLKVGTNLGYTSTDYRGLVNSPGGLSSAIANATKQLPNTPVYDPSNPTGYNIYNTGSKSLVGPWDNNIAIFNDITNIRYVLDNNKNDAYLSRIMAGAYAEVSFAKWLTYKLQIGLDRSTQTGTMYWNKVHGDGFAKKGIISDEYQYLNRWNIQNILNFDKTFGKHSIGVTLINEYQKYNTKYFNGGGYGMASDFFGQGVISNSYETQTSGGSMAENGFISYAARLSYNYGQRYYIQASVRRDGLSSLPTANKYGTFPGLSLGWTVSNEAFMETLKQTISNLRVRASYGKVGNTDIGNYAYWGLYGAARYADNNGFAFIQAGNDNLRWETNIKKNIGIDLGLKNDRYTLSVDYFRNQNDGLVLATPVAPSLGIPSNTINRNIGSMLNKGWEFTASADIFKGDKFSWNISGNLTLIKNEILSLVNGQDIPVTYDSGRESVGIQRVGESLRSLYGYQYWGVNKANGNPVYYKADGSLVQGNIANQNYYVFDPNNPNDMSKVSSLVERDKRILGNTLPTYFGSINTTLRYGNFDFSAMIRFSGGNKISNLTRREMLGMDFTNNSTEILGRWQSPDNPGDGWTPRLWGSKTSFMGLNGNTTSRFVEDASFVKIDNVTLGYTIPREIAERINLTKVRIFAVVQNAFIFTKYKGMDPELEVGGIDYNTVPRQRTISMGLNVSF